MTMLHAEWTKLRTISGTGWLLLATAAATAAVSTAVVLATRYSQYGSYQDTTKVALTGIDLGQALIAILAVLAISGEYSSGMIRVTLAAMPRRPLVLAAKAAWVAALTLAAGTLAVLACLLAARLILPGNGFTPGHGYHPISLAHGPTLRAASGSVLYLALIALLSLGIATAVRDSAVAIGLVLAVLYLFPITAQLLDPRWQHDLMQIGPMTAGLSIQATTHLRTLPIAPWPGLGVLAAWSAAALLTGGLLLHLRDA